MSIDIQTLLTKLISFESVTPKDAGCQAFMLDFLSDLGFRCQRLDKHPVSNFYAEFGAGDPLLIFAGHTDVVPIGEAAQWKTNPFQLHEHEGMLYGRGVADMKGSLASMLLAAERFAKQHTSPQGRFGFLITSAEEGDDYALGTPYVMEQLKAQGIIPHYCIVGEPSSTHQVGDTLKIGRRGSLSGRLLLRGKQGHVAYPHLAKNPIHDISAALNELIHTTWDQGNAHFPPTSFQITQIQSGGYAYNIIPGELALQFNFRYATEQTAKGLQEAVEACFERYQLNPEIHWTLSGEPFLTAKGALLEACIQAIHERTGQQTELSTSGGTSDGRFIAPYGVEVIELGPVNATIHQVNECVSRKELEILTDLYYSVAEKLLT